MGTLYIVATPIGNRQDLSLRAIEILTTAQTILTEDTRRLFKLTSYILDLFPDKHIAPDIVRFDDHTEQQLIPRIIQKLDAGTSIALVSDAGTPLISDPGYRLIRHLLNHTDHEVTSIPGPSAVTNALLLSGLPPYPYMFVGFLPPTSHKIITLLEKLQSVQNHITTTNVAFVSPHKIVKTLEAFDQFERENSCTISCVLMAEMTKLYEKRRAGTPRELLQQLPATIKGEMTLVWTMQPEK